LGGQPGHGELEDGTTAADDGAEGTMAAGPLLGAFALRPVCEVTANGYEQNQLSLRGIIDNPETLRQVHRLFLKTLVWVMAKECRERGGSIPKRWLSCPMKPRDSETILNVLHGTSWPKHLVDLLNYRPDEVQEAPANIAVSPGELDAEVVKDVVLLGRDDLVETALGSDDDRIVHSLTSGGSESKGSPVAPAPDVALPTGAWAWPDRASPLGAQPTGAISPAVDDSNHLSEQPEPVRTPPAPPPGTPPMGTRIRNAARTPSKPPYAVNRPSAGPSPDLWPEDRSWRRSSSASSREQRELDGSWPSEQPGESPVRPPSHSHLMDSEDPRVAPDVGPDDHLDALMDMVMDMAPMFDDPVHKAPAPEDIGALEQSSSRQLPKHLVPLEPRGDRHKEGPAAKGHGLHHGATAGNGLRPSNLEAEGVGDLARLVAQAYIAVDVVPAYGQQPEALGSSHVFQIYTGQLFDKPAEAMQSSPAELRWLAQADEVRRMTLKAFRYALKVTVDCAAMAEDASALEFAELEVALQELEQSWHLDDESAASWQAAMKKQVPNIMALRKKGADVQLLRMSLREDGVRVGELRSEVVHSIWASESVELRYFTNDDDERYSIQAHPTLFRNMIVQSAEYPIYVSPPTTVWL